MTHHSYSWLLQNWGYSLKEACWFLPRFLPRVTYLASAQNVSVNLSKHLNITLDIPEPQCFLAKSLYSFIEQTFVRHLLFARMWSQSTKETAREGQRIAPEIQARCSPKWKNTKSGSDEIFKENVIELKRRLNLGVERPTEDRGRKRGWVETLTCTSSEPQSRDIMWPN